MRNPAMTHPDQQPNANQPGPDSPPQSPPLVPPPAKKSRLGLALGAAALLVAVIGGTVAVTLAAQNDDAASKAPAGETAWDREQRQNIADETLPDATEPASESTPAGHVVTAADMTLKTKITSKKCFGSAGCNLTVQVIAERKAGVPEPDPGDTWLVTYEITGVDDAPVIGSFEITDGAYTVNEEALGTKTKDSKVKIKITAVDKVGI